jgi:hypothetical protein
VGKGIAVRGLAQVQVADISRERRLADLESTPPQVTLQVLLAGYSRVLKYIEYCSLP